MIGDHIVGDTEQPRQRRIMLDAIAASRAKRPSERLRGDVVPGPVADPPHGIASHRQAMALVYPREHRGLADRSRQQLGVRQARRHTPLSSGAAESLARSPAAARAVGTRGAWSP
jgi:hypothetical protein